MLNDHMEVLLGDNPFFGIDHLSQDRARKRMTVLTGMDKIAEIIQFSIQSGMKGFVVSTHPQLRDLIEFLQNNSDLLTKLEFYPIIPYAQGYVSKVTERGMMGAINSILSSGTAKEKMKIVIKGSMGFIQKDFDKLLQTFIDIELIPLRNVQKKVIFLHDVVTDLAISLQMRNIITEFIDHVKTNYHTKAGLVTKNFPRLIDKLNEWNIDIPVIMTSFNSIGNQMNPSQEMCEICLKKKPMNLIAMNILAGGLLQPKDAFSYLSNLNIKQAVVGMSTTQHVTDTLMASKSVVK